MSDVALYHIKMRAPTALRDRDRQTKGGSVLRAPCSRQTLGGGDAASASASASASAYGNEIKKLG